MVTNVTKRMRITGVGIKPISHPAKYKGKKVTASLYKVRTKPNGDKDVVIGLYYQNKGRRELWKNLNFIAKLAK